VFQRYIEKLQVDHDKVVCNMKKEMNEVKQERELRKCLNQSQTQDSYMRIGDYNLWKRIEELQQEVNDFKKQVDGLKKQIEEVKYGNYRDASRH
jgi:uncharacterized protein YhaN